MEIKHNPRKWAQRAGQAAGEYLEGVLNPRRSWEEAAKAAKDTYAAAISEAIAEDRFSKGVDRAGDTKWKDGVREKGRTRYQQGTAVAEDEYDKGFRPFVEVLRSLTLSPRGPKGQNYGRVQEVGEALRNAKKNL